MEDVKTKTKYVIVDEYQDTNYVQEQILIKLTENTKNLFVVGDEDQSLYRFRGASVQNILEFPQRMSNCKIVKLETNYRSHRYIVERYDRWMKSVDWSNPNGPSYRYNKKILADPTAEHPDYPAVFSIWGRDLHDEVRRFADLVVWLKENQIIEDYSQVALLLHTVRQEYSGAYLKELAKYNIPAFCPRARAYFENQEIRDLVACFAIIFGWHDDARGKVLDLLQTLPAM